MESTLSIITDTQTAHFVLLPQDEDPDSLIKSQGPEAFEAQLRSAFPLSKFFVMDIVREVSQGQGLRTAEERAQARDCKTLVTANDRSCAQATVGAGVCGGRSHGTGRSCFALRGDAFGCSAD